MLKLRIVTRHENTNNIRNFFGNCTTLFDPMFCAQYKGTETRLKISKKSLKESRKEHIILYIFSCFDIQCNNLNGSNHDHYPQLIYNGNRTEWSLIQSVIVRVITKSDDRAAGARFVHHEYDYRLNWTTRSPVTN